VGGRGMVLSNNTTNRLADMSMIVPETLGGNMEGVGRK